MLHINYNHDDNSILRIFFLHISDCLYLNSSGSTALHIACSNISRIKSMDVLELVLSASEEAIR